VCACVFVCARVRLCVCVLMYLRSALGRIDNYFNNEDTMPFKFGDSCVAPRHGIAHVIFSFRSLRNQEGRQRCTQ